MQFFMADIGMSQEEQHAGGKGEPPRLTAMALQAAWPTVQCIHDAVRHKEEDFVQPAECFLGGEWSLRLLYT